MNKILNEYYNDDLVIHSVVHGTIAVKIDTDLIDKLRELRWCWEAGKGQVYATDLVGDYTNLLGVRSHRVYLWKYVAYLKLGRIINQWHHPTFDYRFPLDGENKVWR